MLSIIFKEITIWEMLMSSYLFILALVLSFIFHDIRINGEEDNVIVTINSGMSLRIVFVFELILYTISQLDANTYVNFEFQI